MARPKPSSSRCQTLGREQLSPHFFRGEEMKYKLTIFAGVFLAAAASWAQVASHAPTAVSQPARPGTPAPAMVITGKPVARVNGTVLTDRDLQREMWAIFPYAAQHNGNVPQEMEPQIRQGAMQMIIFEELLYQEAQRRKITISAERLNRAESDYRKTFPAAAQYNNFVQSEFHGSQQALREEFGVLAEKISEDDYRVMMGDHHKVDRAKLPPDMVKALLAMQAGQVTDLIQIENAYTIVRLNQHVPAGKIKFEDVKAQLMKQLQTKKTNDVRAALDKKLRQNAKVEVL